MSEEHPAYPSADPELPGAVDWTPEEQSYAQQQWDARRRTSAAADSPRPPFEQAVEAHDTDGSAYILPRALDEHRIAAMVEAATARLDPTEDELRTAAEAVAEAVTAEAAHAVAEAHPGAAVEVAHALWGTSALRYDGPDQDQAALYEQGIPADALLEQALASTPGAAIAAQSILTQRSPAAAAPAAQQITARQEMTSTMPEQPAPGIASWYSQGAGNDFMVIARSTHDGTIAPRYVDSAHASTDTVIAYMVHAGERAMEIYDLKAPLAPQLNSTGPVWNNEAARNTQPGPGAGPAATTALDELRALREADFGRTQPGTARHNDGTLPAVTAEAPPRSPRPARDTDARGR